MPEHGGFTKRVASVLAVAAFGALALTSAVFPALSLDSETAASGGDDTRRVLPAQTPSPDETAKDAEVAGSQEVRGLKEIRLLVPWGRAKIAATTPLPLESCGHSEGFSCRVVHRAKGSAAAAQLAEADLVMFDTNTKMTDDVKFYDPERNPLRKRLGLLNIENVWGRMPAWQSKWRVRWFGKANESAWWREHFDVAVSWEEGSRPAPYRYWHTLDKEAFAAQATPRLADKPLKGSAVFIASNCWTRFQTTQRFDRDAWVRNLTALFPVESLGACGFEVKRNGKADEKASARLYNRYGCAKAKPHQKRCITSKYGFFLAYENSLANDYVTEKLYEPLLVGTVPVYLGAANVENHLPTSHCVVKHSDFGENYAALASYMKCLLRNPDMYEHYTGWQARPRFAHWAPRFEDPDRYPLCAVCRLLARTPDGARIDRSFNPPTPAPGTYDEVAGSQAPFKECLPDSLKHVGVSFEAAKKKLIQR
eukprot:Rhum_TRINITY_DN12286_c0_g2::Rhum_TRINITY_DN12286_c0_g2_i1::g.50684::m.50684